MQRGLLLILLFLVKLLVVRCSAQTVPQPQLPFRTFTTANGLINNRISGGALQDGAGYLWAGTDMGLVRYDGRSFRHYPSPEGEYRRAGVTGRWGRWATFALYGYGLARCCGDSVRFIALPRAQRGAIYSVVPLDDTTCYLNTLQRKLYLLRGNVLQELVIKSITKEVTCYLDLLQDAGGDCWMGTDHGLYFFPASDFSKGYRVAFPGDAYINSIRLTPQGDIMISCSRGQYIFRETRGRPDPAPRPIIRRSVEDNAKNGALQSATFTDDSTGWLAANNGLYRVNIRSGAYELFDAENGLPTTVLWDATHDREHNLWLSSENGLLCLGTTAIRTVDVSNERYNLVKSGCVLNDSVFLFYNGRRLFGYNRNTGRCIEYSGASSKGGFVEAVLMSRGSDNKIWLLDEHPNTALSYPVTLYEAQITGTSVHRLRATGTTVINTQRPYYDLGHSAPARSGVGAWFSGEAGIAYYDGHGYYPIRLRWPRDTAAPSDAPLATMPDGSAWHFHRRHGLLHFRCTAAGITEILDSLPTASLRHDDVTAMYGDSRGRLWIGTISGGVYVLLPGAGGAIQQLAPASFSSHYIWCFEEDEAGDVFAGTAQGLDYIHVRNGSFTVERSLYHAELGGGIIYFAKRQGSLLYVGTASKFGIIDLSRRRMEAAQDVAPVVYITGLSVGNNVRNDLPGRRLSLGAGENNLSFEVTAPLFRDERLTQYLYRLTGLSKAWSTPSAEYRINYASIPPGDYVFEVMARSSSGLWSAPAQFSFSVAKPFYATIPFILLVIILTGAVLYSIYRYRLAQILRLHSVRQKISRDLHDDIGAAVTSIGILANISKSDAVDSSRRKQYLETIAGQSRHVSEALADIVWSVNPDADELDTMLARFQRYAAEIFEAKGIRYDFNLPAGSVNHLKLDMERRQHVLMIFKEAVNNLAKYAEATHAGITVQILPHHLLMEIGDNGVGFDPAAPRKGNGLGNMLKRSAALGGSLTIKSDQGKGTTIRLLVPFGR